MNEDTTPIISTRDIDKQKIIDLFNKNVRGRKAGAVAANAGHDGKEGHWLEVAMGLKPNGNNAPDIFGYEMKNATSSKTTFGDWAPQYHVATDKNHGLGRDGFLHIFGRPNLEKEGRYSWSGKPTPKVNKWNDYGQKLIVNSDNYIIAVYKYEYDMRANKADIIPVSFRNRLVIVAVWPPLLMKKRLEAKFNQNGWFKCEKDSSGVYTSIAFGPPITFETWIEYVKTGDVYFDTAMYEGNIRQYAHWRASNAFWAKLISERY